VETELKRFFRSRLSGWKPARANGPRVSCHGERAGVLVVETDVIAGDLEDGRCDEVASDRVPRANRFSSALSPC